MPAIVTIELQGQLALTAKTDSSASGPLWAMIARAGELRYRWEQTRDEDDRLAMRAAWDIHITCTGAELFGQCPKPATGSVALPPSYATRRVTMTTISPTGAPAWAAGGSAPPSTCCGTKVRTAPPRTPTTTPTRAGGLCPRRAAPPSAPARPREQRAVASWRSRWEPLLPEGWLEGGGPVRTEREPNAGRHVPGRAPGGGYDMAGRGDEPEALGGQLALFA